MKNLIKKTSLLLIFSVIVSIGSFAQVGIGTINPNASSILDISSTSKGFLAPRMTTAEKSAIVSPASGLLVFDSTLGKFSFYNGSIWITIEASTGSGITRDNYVLVKSASDLPVPSGGKIILASGVMYEINGSIVVSSPIDINGSEIVGGDVNNDKIIYTGSGALITSIKGGVIKNITMASGTGSNNLFSLNDPSKANNLVIRDSFIANFSSVGSISGYNIVLMELLNFISNKNGVTYTSNKNLFLKDQAWFASNLGTFTKLIGNFEVIGCLGGISQSVVGVTSFDVSGVSSISNAAFINGVSFTGLGIRTNGIFSKEWEIDSPGIRTEKDDVATGTIYINGPNPRTITSIPAEDFPVKALGETILVNGFRVDNGGVFNRLRYTGTKTRIFSIIGSVSLTSTHSGQVLSLYIAKNGSVLPSTKIKRKIGTGSDIGAAGVSGTVELATGDYVELFVANDEGGRDIIIEQMNLQIK